MTRAVRDVAFALREEPRAACVRVLLRLRLECHAAYHARRPPQVQFLPELNKRTRTMSVTHASCHTCVDAPRACLCLIATTCPRPLPFCSPAR